MRSRERFAAFGSSLFALASLSLVACNTGTPETGATEQSVISHPPPSNLNFTLYANTNVTIDSSAQVTGDIGTLAISGLVFFDRFARQGNSNNLLANAVQVASAAVVGNVFGNDLAISGSATQQNLGLDLAILPAIPALTPVTPGTASVSLPSGHTIQLCPGQYGTISLASGATLNLNGGVYQISSLSLADGARLEPSEPVVILVANSMTVGNSTVIAPFPELVNPMSAADIRIEVGTSASVGSSSVVRAHLLVPNGPLSVGSGTSLTGAAWADRITIGVSSVVSAEGALSRAAPSVPPPCNDNDACTADACVTAGATAFCRNTPITTGACGPQCGDGVVDLGEECDDGANNGAPGDRCEFNCTLARCGNGILDSGEQCDDGNGVNGDGCEFNCTLPQCGNGILDPGEQCDDGNVINGDGCSSTCTFPTCGNGVLDPGEEIDPPVSPSSSVPVNAQTCRFDFSAIPQLYCNGGCGTWGGSPFDCQQTDADVFCRLRTGNPASTAISFRITTALAAPGICCPGTGNAAGCKDLGNFADRGVTDPVAVHDTNLLSTHGAGLVVTDVTCTP